MAQAFLELDAQDESAQSRPPRVAGAALDRAYKRASRNTKRFQSRLRVAGRVYSQAAITRRKTTDFNAAWRRLDKALFQQLGHEPLDRRAPQPARHRPCGVGKSWLSCALAHKACRDGYAVYYARARRCSPISNSRTATAGSPGCSACWSRSISSSSTNGSIALTASQRRDLMEIVEDRHGRGSILITSQLPVPTWHDVIGEPTLGDASATALFFSSPLTKSRSSAVRQD